MPFKKGDKPMGGRPKGTKNKQRLIRYSPKKWQTISKHNVYDQEEVIWRLENDLPLEDMIDIMNEKYNKDDKDV